MSGPPNIRALLISRDVHVCTRILALLGEAHDARFHLDGFDQLSTGLHHLTESGADVVLLDVGVPDSRALADCTVLHTRAPGVPLVVLADADDPDAALEALQRGAQDVLLKAELDSRSLARAIRFAVQRCRADERRRHGDERLRVLIDQVPAVLWTTDRDLRFTSSAGSGLFALALRPNELVGTSLAEYFGTDAPGYPPIEAHRRAIDGESVSFDFPWHGCAFSVHVEPLYDEAGRTAGAIGVALDVSDRRRLDHNLDLARQIQQTLFPRRPPQLPGFDIAGAVFPAETTAGDYYDFIPMPAGRLGLVVGDVSGHGLGPALLMAELRAYLRPLATTRDDVGEILTLANRFLADDLEEHHFVTAFLARLDPATRTLDYAGAGHCAYRLGADDVLEDLPSTGLPLGLVNDAPIPAGRPVSLRPGDLLLIATDGFHESFAGDQIFGMARLWEVVRRHRDRPAAEIIEALHRAVLAYSDERFQRDDMTAIAIKCQFA